MAWKRLRETIARYLGYHQQGLDGWWLIITKSEPGGLLDKPGAQYLVKFKAKHFELKQISLKQISRCLQNKAIWMSREVLIAQVKVSTSDLPGVPGYLELHYHGILLSSFGFETQYQNFYLIYQE